MSNERRLLCLRCGAPIESGYECAECASPEAQQSRVSTGAAPRSDGPKLAISACLLLFILIGGFFTSKAIAANLAQDHAAYQRQADLRERLKTIAADSRAKRQAEAEARIRSRYSAPERADVPSTVPTNSYTPPSTVYSAPVVPPVYQSPAPSPPLDTTIACSRCGGTGYITIVCPKCQGKGEIVCGHCTSRVQFNGGEPDPNCTECGGTSHQGTGWQHFLALYTCPECHGTKRITVKRPDCHGTGKIDMAQPPPPLSNLDP